MLGEGGRAIGVRDIESVTRRTITGHVGRDPAIARVVDAGLMTARMPRQLRQVAEVCAGVEVGAGR